MLANLAQMLRMNTQNTTPSNVVSIAPEGKVWSETQNQWVAPGVGNGAMPSQNTLMPTYITDNLNGQNPAQNPLMINSFSNMYNNAQPSTVGMVGTMNPGLVDYWSYLNGNDVDPTKVNNLFAIKE